MPTRDAVASSELDLPVRTGQILEGKFRIERIIGEGAMGLVAEAMHLDLEEHVALKFLHREARARPDIVARFAREARAAARIKSDHVARVYDVGWTEDGAPFIVMELLEGMDLELLLAKSGPLDITEAVEHVIQACEGLTSAHALGVVHRDIKPANLFRVDRSGTRQVKLLDFGISKAGISSSAFDDGRLLSADTTQIMGSPHYMSPEQIRSTKDVDARADIWSLGVVLYELVSGDTPFTATEITGIIAQVLHEPHRPVRMLLPDIPDGLEQIIEKCLSKDPDGRYQSAADLAEALLPFAPKRARTVVERAVATKAWASGNVKPTESLPPPPLSSPTITKEMPKSSAAPLSIAVPSRPPEPARSPFVWAALACIIFGLTGGVLALAVRLRGPTSERAAVAAAPVEAREPNAIASSSPAGPATGENVPGAAGSQPAAATPAGSASEAAAPAIAQTPRTSPAQSARPAAQRPARPASSTTAAPENDIRHER